jgi:hypothetical protein
VVKMERIKNYDLMIREKQVNELLSNIQLKVSKRYGYVAIDILDKKTNNVKSTLIAGLTKRSAYDILTCIEIVLEIEKYKPKQKEIPEETAEHLLKLFD